MVALDRDWNDGGSALYDDGESPSIRALLNPGQGITLAQLRDIPVSDRRAGLLARVDASFDPWVFDPNSSLTADNILVAAPTSGPGRWLRAPGWCTLYLPMSSATADAAALLTMQGQQAFAVDRFAGWRVTTSFTGGTSSAIGCSSNKTTPTDWSTKGDLLGGGSGALAAALTAGFRPGAIGTDMDTLAKVRGLVLVAGDVIRHDLIASQFTAGAGFVVVQGNLLVNG